MEKSQNWKFNLPNSSNDEVADINLISENFKIIDSSMNVADQTFNPESTKSASGKAVKEAIDGIQPIDENTEFIFDGGDASGGIPVDIVVDSTLSKTSTNAIQNKVVATKADELTNLIAEVKKELSEEINNTFLKAHPVGVPYFTMSSDNPGDKYGGTWERIKGRFLYAIDDGETAGTTGGEKEHTLTVAEMPTHSHQQAVAVARENGSVNVRRDYNDDGNADIYSQDNVNTATAGSGEAHNNMPPYYGFYCWLRTA